MADGVTHYKYLRMGWFIIIPISLILTMVMSVLGDGYAFLYLFFININFYLCEYCDPDNDSMVMTGNESRTLKVFQKFYMGFFGALWVSYSFLYAYIISLVGGHRSFWSHGVGIGTLGRMIFFNIPLLCFFYFLYGYGLQHWNWRADISVYHSFDMHIWFPYYIISQATAWFIGDGIHLILDTEWAKGRLYETKNTKRKSNNGNALQNNRI